MYPYMPPSAKTGTAPALGTPTRREGGNAKRVPALGGSDRDYASSSRRLRVRFGSTGMPGPVFVETVTFLT